MAATAELRGVLNFDTKPFEGGLNRGEVLARDFDIKLQGIFRRSKGFRAEHALSGLIEDLSSGNIIGALTSITSRMGVFGVVASVGIGAGVAVVGKLAQQFKEADQSALKLEADISKPVSSAMGVDQLSARLKEVQQGLDDFIAKHHSFASYLEQGSLAVSNSLNRMVPSGVGKLFPATQQGPVEDEATKGRQAALEQETRILALEADSARRLVAIRRQGVDASETDAAIAKDRLQWEQKILSIDTQLTEYRASLNASVKEGRLTRPEADAMSTVAGLSAERQREAAFEDARLSVEIDRQKGQVRDRELQGERDVLQLSREILDPEQLRLATAKEHVALLEEELALQTHLSNEVRSQKQLEIDKAKVEMESLQRQQLMTTFRSVFEKAHFSLADLLGVDERQASPGLSYAHHQAQMAEHEDMLGEQLKQRGDLEGAFAHFMEAERIKSQIEPLSDKEKSPELAFRNAIDSAQVFRDMIQAIRGIKLNLSY